MFKATIGAEKLKDIVEAISALVDETRLKFAETGVSIKAVDPANVAMVSFSLPKDGFDTYEATDGEIGLDFLKISSILEMAGAGSTVELALDEEKHKLGVTIQSDSVRGLYYTLSLLDPSSIRKEPKIPDLALPAQIVLRGEDLRRGIKAAEKVGDHVAMGVAGDIFYMEAEGDVDTMRLELTRDQLINLKTSDARSLFSLEYLTLVGKSAGKAGKVTLNLGKDYPAKIKFNIAEKGEVEYMLAPRVESE